jgi:hypothetical protein
MKSKFLSILIFLSLLPSLQAQENKINYEFIWLNFGMGAGAVVSTNIINSGAVLPFYMEIYLQQKRHRYGIGLAHELYITPQNLGQLILGNSANTEKVYFTYELMLLPNFPINIGVHFQAGGFLVGNDIQKANEAKNKDVPEYNFFGNVGLLAEVGIRPVFLFVKPYIEYKSYGGFHKELIVCGTFGIKFKLKQK